MHCRDCLKYHLTFILFFKFLTFLILFTEAEVRFDRNLTTFYENDGNPSVFLVLQGGVLLQDLTVNIYDIDTSENN